MLDESCTPSKKRCSGDQSLEKQKQLVCLSNTLMEDDHSQKEAAFIKKTWEVFTKKGGKHQSFCRKHVSQLPSPPSLRWKTWQSKAFFSTKIPFLLTTFICQTHFLFPHSNFIQKNTRVPRRSRGKTLQTSLAHLFLPLSQMQQFDSHHVSPTNSRLSA